ncbi:cold-responsive protein kinase 1-like [Abrus precatorius]|uniref:Cold-responsive protein kinase 1-like n=1 Tax=Abrus precatorius TaxID=3816 RepID=A0A8B8K1X2_ABRPR|nr:cold-responsive protein kinase 1-like [Abrus precatorius]
MLQLKLLALTMIWGCINLHGAVANPQTHFVNKGCSPYNASNMHSFFANINDTFSRMRAQISNQNKHFATAEKARGEMLTYSMFQCRNYLSKNDCLACFTTATAQIRNCSDANGARIIYDGCFLRYESERFYDQTTEPGNGVSCVNTSAKSAGFRATGLQVLMDLQTATPSIKGFFAATKTPVVGVGAIYAFAQCVETITPSGCLDCLKVGYNNLYNCLPNTDGRAYDAGCFMRYSTTPFFPDNQTIVIKPYLKQGGSSKKWAIIGGVVGGGGLLVILLALFAWRRSRKPKRVPRGDILGATELKGPVNYKYDDLKAATKNFSNENKLGEGGFGDVYKGTLKNGKIVAVKKLVLRKSNKMEDDFESEVKLISNVHHRNLVRLLGCCSKGEERILVYEYMANSSLDRFLFGNSSNKGSLNWTQRYDIILGTARGLAYLHEEFHVSIIHRDIKTGNILLDDDLQPKIADFGLARLLPGDRSHLSTRFAGTLGYTAPEYAIHGQLSEKADTYSYGIVVLEIISGQKSTNVREDEDGREYLLKRAWKLYERGMHLELVDKGIDPNDYDGEEVQKIIEIALLCTQASAASRPTMSEVVVLLKSKSLFEHLQPTMPVFVESNLKNREGNSTSSTTGSSSKATASISVLSAR